MLAAGSTNNADSKICWPFAPEREVSAGIPSGCELSAIMGEFPSCLVVCCEVYLVPLVMIFAIDRLVGLREYIGASAAIKNEKRLAEEAKLHI